MEDRIIIYTDGSCLKNPGPGGWAYHLEYRDKELNASGSEKETTNNRMELTAVIKALESIKKPLPLTIHTDSEYIYNAFMKKWLYSWEKNSYRNSTGNPVKNRDLWEKLSALAKKHDIMWVKVKAHSDDPLNIMVDRLANEAAKGRFRNGQDDYSKEMKLKEGLFIIRNCRKEDIKPIKMINDSTLNQKGLVEKQGLRDSDFDMLFRKNNTARVLEHKDKIIGFYWLFYDNEYFRKYYHSRYMNDDTVYLLAIAVDNAFQKRGLGKILIENIYEFTQKLGKRRILLDVASSNRNACSWYQKEGFDEVETQMFMVKELTDE